MTVVNRNKYIFNLTFARIQNKYTIILVTSKLIDFYDLSECEQIISWIYGRDGNDSSAHSEPLDIGSVA